MRFCRFVVLWLTLASMLVQQSRAAEPSDFLRYGANSVTATGMPGLGTPDFDRFMGRVIGGSSGNIVADVRLQGSVRGASVPFTVSRIIPSGAAARAVGRALGLPGVVALSLVAIANETRCRNVGTPILPIFECDQGEAGSGGMQPLVSNCWIMQQWPGNMATGCRSSAEVLAQAIASYYQGVQGIVYRVAGCTPVPPTQASCVLEYQQGNGSWTYSSTWQLTTAAAPPPPGCPSGLQRSTLGGVSFCPTGTYSPSTESDVADRVGANPGFQNDPGPPLIGAGQVGSQPAPGTGATTIGAPSTVNLPSTHRSGQGTGGGTWTEVAVPVATLTCTGDTCSWSITTTTTRTTTNPDGSTTVTTGTETDGTGTQGDVITCGLPNTPACKIDERGTPTQAEYGTARGQLDERGNEAQQQVEQQATPRPLPWLWGGIGLPTGACANMTVESPHPSIANATVDICGQPWVAWWRTALAWVAGLWTAAYCWRRFSDTVEAT